MNLLRRMRGLYLGPLKFMNSMLSLVRAPIKTLWDRDKTFILIFVIVNLVIAQLGVIISIALSIQKGYDLLKAFDNNLTSGAFYIFSISLVVSSLAVIGSELIDAIRNQEAIRYFDAKVIWGILGLAAVVLQAPMAGSLLSRDDVSNYECEKLVHSQLDSHCITANSAYVDKNASVVGKGGPGALTAFHPINIDSIQLTAWLFSMLIAFELYCLHRIPLISDKYAAHRQAEINELIELSEKRTTTSFGEAV